MHTSVRYHYHYLLRESSRTVEDEILNIFHICCCSSSGFSSSSCDCDRWCNYWHNYCHGNWLWVQGQYVCVFRVHQSSVANSDWKRKSRCRWRPEESWESGVRFAQFLFQRIHFLCITSLHSNTLSFHLFRFDSIGRQVTLFSNKQITIKFRYDLHTVPDSTLGPDTIPEDLKEFTTKCGFKRTVSETFNLGKGTRTTLSEVCSKIFDANKCKQTTKN